MHASSSKERLRIDRVANAALHHRATLVVVAVRVAKENPPVFHHALWAFPRRSRRRRRRQRWLTRLW